MQFTSPGQAATILKRAVNKQKNVHVVNREQPSFYGGGANTGHTALAQLCRNKKNEIYIDLLSSLAKCRGFAMETMFSHPAFSMGPKVKTPQNITCIYAGLSDYGCKIGLALVNNLEYQTGWPLTKVVKMDKNKYVILGSKRWSACLPLYSAYILLFRTVYVRVLTKKQEPNNTWRENSYVSLHSLYIHGAIEKIFGALEDHLKYTTDTYEGHTSLGLATGLALCFQNNNLLKLMRHYKHLTGPALYKNIKSRLQLHDTGIGDFLLLLRDYEKHKSSHLLKNQPTYRAHGKMIERMRKMK